MLTGGCYCGAIRYEASARTLNQTICHCAICRRTTGAPCVAWFTVATADFRLLGSPAQFRSSKHGMRTFCQTCGTQITFADDVCPGEIDVTTCSLDQPAGVPPQTHIFTEDKIDWLKLADSLPQYRRSRAET